MKTFVTMALVVGVAVSVGGCCKKSSSSTSSTGSTSSDAVKLSNAHVQFNPPDGWKHIQAGDWQQYMASDKTASLAFVTFTKPGESTTRINEMGHILGVDVDWSHAGNRKAGTVGHDAFPAQAGDTDACKTKGGDPCYLWYATVNGGATDQLLIVYAVDMKGGAHNKPNAKAAVDSLRKL